MRIIIVFLLVILSTKLIGAVDKPQPIESRLTEIHSKGWYEEKVKTWESYFNENPGEENDWLEYFQAARYAGRDAEFLINISRRIETNYQGSFTDYYVKSNLMGWNDEGVKFLRNAIDIIPDSKDILPAQIMLAELDQNSAKRALFGERLFNSGRIYSSLINYSYNVLMSVDDNGILVVEGQPATIPLWILQDVMEVRRDVKILNLDLAVNSTYLEDWLESSNLKVRDLSLGIESIILDLPDYNPEYEFYYSLTLPNEKVNTIQDNLFVVGLTSLHKTKEFDHFQVLRKNIENRFLIDYLTVDFNGEPRNASGKVYEVNYILPFLLLKEFYDESGDLEASQKWEEQILMLADRSQIKTRVAMLMGKRGNVPSAKEFTKTEIDVKKIDKRMKKVKGNIYASSVEVTNKDFWEFLEYLRVNGYEDLYQKSIPNLEKYDEITASFMKNYIYSPVNYEIQIANPNKYKKPSFVKYPAVEMSFEAANAYCEWLTFQYNNQENRNYKKVKFRLPTKQEWSVAALGYKNFTSWNLEENTIRAWDENAWSDKSGTKKNEKYIKEYNVGEANILYPWWYPNIKFSQTVVNAKGCYLANIKAPEEISCAAGFKGDGYTLMSGVGSYFGNGMGLYDVVGNVAEMINLEGIAMGGSWNHPAEESTIKSTLKYEVSDITVGFRLFMEVIEE